jgi:hypothetical protein
MHVCIYISIYIFIYLFIYEAYLVDNLEPSLKIGFLKALLTRSIILVLFSIDHSFILTLSHSSIARHMFVCMVDSRQRVRHKRVPRHYYQGYSWQRERKRRKNNREKKREKRKKTKMRAHKKGRRLSFFLSFFRSLFIDSTYFNYLQF